MSKSTYEERQERIKGFSCTSMENSTWSATIRAAIDSRSQAVTSLTEFEKENFLDFRFQKSVNAENSDRLVFKVLFSPYVNQITAFPRKTKIIADKMFMFVLSIIL